MGSIEVHLAVALGMVKELHWIYAVCLTWTVTNETRLNPGMGHTFVSVTSCLLSFSFSLDLLSDEPLLLLKLPGSFRSQTCNLVETDKQ